MKHIKRFNESNEEDLKDFCETHLAYLLDDYNFELYVDDINDDSMRSLSDSGQIRIENTEGFKWDDIKDYFIPFLKQLDKIRGHQIKIGGEKLVFIHTTTYNLGWTKLPFDDLVNDRTTLRNMYWDKIHIELNETY